jgi:hypothetical protein
MAASWCAGQTLARGLAFQQRDSHLPRPTPRDDNRYDGEGDVMERRNLTTGWRLR